MHGPREQIPQILGHVSASIARVTAHSMPLESILAQLLNVRTCFKNAVYEFQAVANSRIYEQTRIPKGCCIQACG